MPELNTFSIVARCSRTSMLGVAVSTAGGFTYRAVTDQASIVRNTEGTTAEGTVTRRSLIQPGDVITVFERHF